jgi:hypothetical protein
MLHDIKGEPRRDLDDELLFYRGRDYWLFEEMRTTRFAVAVYGVTLLVINLMIFATVLYAIFE